LVNNVVSPNIKSHGLKILREAQESTWLSNLFFVSIFLWITLHWKGLAITHG
jgi:hypothetical protein